MVRAKKARIHGDVVGQSVGKIARARDYKSNQWLKAAPEPPTNALD